MSGHEDHDLDERIGALSSPLGATQRPVTECIAGDICAVAKLARAETSDTLSDKDDPALVEPWILPDALLPVAIVAATKSDEDKLSQALQRLVVEDPTLRLENNPETHQLVLWTMGEAHVDVLLDRLSTRYGVQVTSVPMRVSLRETFSGPASGKGRHVKQSGGHGQYAVCDIRVEPLDSGAGFEFVDKVVGGSVPRQFIPSVEKGVRAQMERGVLAGYPVVDIRVTLVEGKAHSVDSSDMAFQMAGALALREAAKDGSVSLLEPMDEVQISVADEYVGSVMSDLSTPTWPGHRDRAGGSGPQRDPGRGPADRDHPLRHRPALALPRHRDVRADLPAARADALARRGDHRDRACELNDRACELNDRACELSGSAPTAAYPRRVTTTETQRGRPGPGDDGPEGADGPDATDGAGRAGSAGAVRPLGGPARSWRVLLLAVLTALFVAGSLKGNDTAWPFGPWRMFSTSQAPTGAVVAMAIQAETSDGQWFDAALSPSNVGLNRAEVEGRIPQIVSDPGMLGTLARSHSRLRPHEQPWIGVRVVRRASVIVDRVPTGEVDSSVLATWTTHGVTTGGPM